MSNIVIPKNFGQLATAFSGVRVEDDLSSGVGQSFGVISYRGKVWAVKYQGQESKLMRPDGDGPRNSIEVVIVRSANVISKIFYNDGYVEGSSAPPDCWSTNGQTPDPASPKKQSATCAGCPQNAWGSKITDAGKQGKACADSKRLAVVPVEDIDNEMFGGPMLLRVPAASLKDLASFGQKLKAIGYPYYAVATRISFDPDQAYPRFQFGAIRALDEEEAAKIMELRDDERVARILNAAVENVTHEPEASLPKPEDVFEQPPRKTAPTAPAAPKPAPKPAPKAVTAEVVDEETGEVMQTPMPKPAPKKAAPPPPVDDEDEDQAASTSAPSFDAMLDNLLK